VSRYFQWASPYLPFVELGRLGLDDWWRYPLVGALLLIVPWYAFDVLFYLLDWLDPALTQQLHQGARTGWGADFPLWAGVVDFSLSLAWLGAIIPAAFVFVPLIHRRPWRSLVMAPGGFDWRGFTGSLIATIVVFCTPTVIGLLSGEIDNPVVFDGWRFAAFLPSLLILLPAQTLGEEVLFRGYLLQSVARATDNPQVRLAIPALLFAVWHFENPEVQAGGIWMGIDHFVTALYMTALAIRGNGLALPWGYHLGNNLVAFTIFAPGPAENIPQPSIFGTVNADPVFSAGDVFWSLIFCAAHYWLVFHVLPRWRLGRRRDGR
jgi:membrane protease YdiL (CAAX protease family)